MKLGRRKEQSAQILAPSEAPVSVNADVVISVIICVYNGEKYLDRTLQSVLAQRGIVHGRKAGNGIEVVIIDDCSADQSLAIIEKYLPVFRSNGFAVKLIRHPVNKSIIASYTEGVLTSRGKYFKILDHDDTLASETALAHPVQFMEDMAERGIAVGAVFSKTSYMNKHDEVFGEKRFPFPFLPFEASDGLIARRWGQFVLAFSPIYPFVHGGAVTSKECWAQVSAKLLAEKEIGLFDVLLAISIMYHPVWRAGYLRAPALNYRIHTTNFTQTAGDSRGGWSNILNEHYTGILGPGLVCQSVISWNRWAQMLKSRHYRTRGLHSYKTIKIFKLRRQK